ncbi:ATP-binding cassette domain-containing protein [Euzebya pacifica]|uniref:ATP-binding cassette domain-containing protein n=1 Tax=Euzebya pacifica TaxID=1608957 RepID=UPI0030F9B540
METLQRKSLRQSPIADVAIHAEGLVKEFAGVRALDGLDLDVPTGSVLGLLGPNGAGKTTAVSILTTLLRPDGGTASVAGHDVATQPERVRRLIGLSGQYAAVDENLTGVENLVLVGKLYRLGARRARQRANELLEQFSLVEPSTRLVGTYSGGMRRRLDLAGALVAEPPVLFLDEPTTGLDPRSRNELWAAIDDLVTRGTTVLLTTQYMEEAEQLADDIVVIDHGRRIAQGTADELKALVGGDRIEVRLLDPLDAVAAERALAGLADGVIVVDGRLVTAPVLGGAGTLGLAVAALAAERVAVTEVGLRRPTLDDVFLTLTGQVS